MFKPENGLEGSLVRAFDEPGHREAFLKELLAAELSLALLEPEGKGRSEGYAVPEVTHEDLAFIPVFTADSRVKAMFGEERMMVVRQSFRQIVDQMSDANFVLNPGSDYGQELFAEQVAAMLKGDFAAAAKDFSAGEVVGGDEARDVPTLVGKPNPAPTHLTKPLAELFATMPEVRSAHMAQAIFADPDGIKRLVIGIATDGDIDAALDRVEDVLEAAARPTDVIDFVPVPGSPLDGYFERDTQPFYRKA